MRWRSITSGMAAVAVVSGGMLVTQAAFADDSKDGVAFVPPHTLTQAGYTTAGGTRGTVDLETAGTAGKVPGTDPIVVSLGESYISGEAGRWAGNPLASFYEQADALGEAAYWDLGSAEAIPDCHRAKAAPINFGAGTTAVNLACSGALTGTGVDSRPFKPGIDFADSYLFGGARAKGQAALLANLAASNPGRVKMVTLSIGGNDFKFEELVTTCVTQYLLAGTPCSRVDDVTELFEQENVETQRKAIATAMGNVARAMKNAGYSEDQWKLVVQTYPSPIADRANIRYGQNLARQLDGGCGFYDKDLDWANGFALPTINESVRWAVEQTKSAGNDNVVLLDLATALNGHRLCEKGTNMVGPIKTAPELVISPIANWMQPDAADSSEWIAQIRATTKVGLSKPFSLYESFHPNYWAQKAYQNCYRQAYNNGRVRGGKCDYAGPGLTQDGLPNMKLATSEPDYVPPPVEPVTPVPAPVPAPMPAPVTPTKPSTPKVIVKGKAPAKVRALVVKRVAGRSALIRWQAPSGKAQVRAYLYRTRTPGHRWSRWISVGRATQVRLKGLPRGRTTVQVLARNQYGVGTVATVSVVRKAG